MKTFLLFIIFISSLNASAIVNEIGFDFGYDIQKYGSTRQNSIVSRSYSGGISSYIFSTTAIDLNFSSSTDTTTENNRYNVATGYDIVGQQNRVKTTVYGLGIKQALASKTSALVPLISVGYARQFVDYTTDITIENTTSKARSIASSGTTKERTDSVFASFVLQLKLTDQFSLKGSVKTIFPAFEFNKAKDDLKYLAGFSWMF